MSDARIMGGSIADDADLTVTGDDLRPMEVLAFDLGTSTGEQDITLSSALGKGRVPIGAVFVVGKTTTSGTTLFGGMSIGFFDGVTSLVEAAHCEDDVDTTVDSTNTVSRTTDDECIMVLDTDGTVLSEAVGVEFIANGVTINVGVTDGNAYKGVVYLFFDEHGSAKVELFANPTVEDETITVTPGINTTALMTLSSGGSFSDQTNSSATFRMGFALPSADQTSYFWQSQDNVDPSQVAAKVSTTAGVTLDGAKHMVFDNFTDTTFDVTVRGGGAAGKTGYLALNMPSCTAHVGVLDTPTSTGNQNYTAPAFQAQSALFILTTAEAVDTTEADNDAECVAVGGANDDDVGSVQIADKDAVTTTSSETTVTTTLNARNAGAVEQAVAASFAEHANGFTLNYTTVHSNAKKWPYLAMRYDQKVDNIQNTDVRKVFRSITDTDQVITGSFASQTVNMIHLTNINPDSGGTDVYQLELSDDGFSTTKLTENFDAWTKDMAYRDATHYFADTVATDFRLTVDGSQHTTDGYMEIGRLLLGQYFNAPNSQNVSVGPLYSHPEIGELIQTRGGGFRAEQLTSPRSIKVVWEWIKDDDAWDIDANSFAEILEHTGYRDDLFISVYPGDADDRERRHTLVGRLINNTGIQGHFITVQGATQVLYSRLGITVQESL